MKEIKSLRKKREKHFLKEDGTMEMHLFKEDIHFLKNGSYFEIDNTFLETEYDYQNKANDFQVIFPKDQKKLIKIKKENYFLNMNLLNSFKGNRRVTKKQVKFENILKDVTIFYEMQNQELKENIVLTNQDNIPNNLIFEIETNLKLELENNKIVATFDSNEIFHFPSLFAVDKIGQRNNDFFYELELISTGKYQLTLKLNNPWLQNPNLAYPVIIDPSIATTSDDLEDIFIFPGDEELAQNDLTVLKVGVDQDKITYRSLLKFKLPTISTGSSIIEAKLGIYSHPKDYGKQLGYNNYVSVHEITSDWNESTAKWNQMKDKFNPHIEECIISKRTVVDENDTNKYIPSLNYFNITNLVKRWYSGKPNYGVMLKWLHEEMKIRFREYDYCSKNVTNGAAMLIISYRNQNGLENYLSTQNISHINGFSAINHLNGNLTSSFSLNKTIGGKKPISLGIIYNTNDVINNNMELGAKGWMFSYSEAIKELTIDDTPFLEYKDSDGTLHYFWKEKRQSNETETDYLKREYIDEDGLGLKAILENNQYIVSDSDSNKMKFTKNGSIFYLTNSIDTEGNTNEITLDSNHRITKITDANASSINIVYEPGLIKVISDYATSKIYLSNQKITKIETKNGATTFLYNENNIITKIIDSDGMSTKYDYYKVIPYRMQKITEYGLNNEEGHSLTFEYGYDVTKITDELGRKNIHSFNNNGVTIGVTNLKDENDFEESYGVSNEYIEYPYSKINNKLAVQNMPMKITRNYIKDGSFETLNTIQDAKNVRNGKHSLEVINEQTIYLESFPNEGVYTFSGYFKNDVPITIMMERRTSGTYHTFARLEIPINQEFKRYEIHPHFMEEPENATYSVRIESSNINGHVYVDDVQFEKGDVANYQNIVENSAFQNGMANWTNHAGNMEGNDISSDDIIITLPNGKKAYQMNCKKDVSKSLSQTILMSGKKGDTYNLSFWYKNLGIQASDMYDSNIALLSFKYTVEVPHGVPACVLNLHATEWQFFSRSFVAEEDYEKVFLSFISQMNANELFLSNISVTKDLEFNSFGYDEEGNLTSAKDQNNQISTFQYDKNNQLVGSFNPKGNNFSFEYDNTITNRLLKGISGMGIANEIKYDEFHNPIKTIIRNVRRNSALQEKNYFLRVKGTEGYFSPNFQSKKIDITNSPCSPDAWKIEFAPDNYYRLKSAVVPIYMALTGSAILLTRTKTDDTLFSISKNKNGSFSITPKYAAKHLSNKDGVLYLEDFMEDQYSQQFYFEDAESSSFLETRTEYSEDGKFVTKTIDALGLTTNYKINPQNGLTEEVIDANQIATKYTYNESDQISSVTKNDTTITYDYNAQNLLEKIKSGKKEYQFLYDNFSHPKQVKIGNTPLITNEYEPKNGNLKKSAYGNNHSISYTYDDYDRIKTKTNQNHTYSYLYDNNGDIARISDWNDIYNYYYDFAKRISSYQHDNFEIDYDYDINNNITEKKYKNELLKHISYTYNQDDSVIKVSFDNNHLNYNYDELGRLTKKDLNGKLPVEYEYYHDGKKSSMILKSMKIGSDFYEYYYDNLYNITHLYKNNGLLNQYDYDNFNQLIKEDNYDTLKSYLYTYDSSGNLLRKTECELNTYNFLTENKYEYNNPDWEDQLTSYNNIPITYDAIGNPLTIGETVLSWQNGRELKSYQDNHLNINYQYDKDGIRSEKKINDVTIKYFTENNHIIFEQRNSDMLYYIRDDNNHLIGFEYKNTRYYYQKNIQEDIIGIYNSNYEKVANYSYDSWGNILSIKDNLGNEITDENHIAHINPFRYRSYYYDTETKLYYLNSRYYNPLWGRFINADNYVSTDSGLLGHNMYSYCNNNSIIHVDKSGHGFLFAIITGVIAITSSVLIKHNNENNFKKAQEEIKNVQAQHPYSAFENNKSFYQELKKNASQVKKETQGKSLIDKSIYLAENTKTLSKYDLKNTIEWSNKTIYYENMWMESQDLGNYHFGYIGRAAGIPLIELTTGAGAYQLLGNTRYIPWCFTSSTCDDPRDNYFIRLGAIAYDKNNS